jgi:hypothetical protein
VRAAVLYFYDGDNQPRWVLGQDGNSGSARLPMRSYRGFCPDCARVPTSSSEAGHIDLAFSGSRNATLTTDTFDAGQPDSPWQRGPVAIVPLSDPVLHPEQF